MVRFENWATRPLAYCLRQLVRDPNAPQISPARILINASTAPRPGSRIMTVGARKVVVDVAFDANTFATLPRLEVCHPHAGRPAVKTPTVQLWQPAPFFAVVSELLGQALPVLERECGWPGRLFNDATEAFENAGYVWTWIWASRTTRGTCFRGYVGRLEASIDIGTFRLDFVLARGDAELYREAVFHSVPDAFFWHSAHKVISFDGERFLSAGDGRGVKDWASPPMIDMLGIG